MPDEISPPAAADCLDTSGWLCPHPLRLARQQLKQLAPGQILKVISTDPSSVVDFKVFAATTDHTLLYFMQQGARYEFWLCKQVAE